MDDFYGKKNLENRKKNFRDFFFFLIFLWWKKFRFRFFSARAAAGGQNGGEAPLKASEASLAPQASHQPPKAASVRVYPKCPICPKCQNCPILSKFPNSV